MSGGHQHDLIPALRFRWLTPAYDLVVRLTTRESSFKSALVAQLAPAREARVLDLGCGTATLSLMVKSRFPDARVSGVDGDPEILHIARAKALKSGLQIDVQEAMAQETRRFLTMYGNLALHRARKPARRPG